MTAVGLATGAGRGMGLACAQRMMTWWMRCCSSTPAVASGRSASGDEASFLTGVDILVDGGVCAAVRGAAG